MSKQLYFEDVEVGQEVPPVHKLLTNEMLTRYCGATDDYSRQHYDHLYAVSRGWDTVIAHGLLGTAFLGQMLTDWIGEDGWVRKIGDTYRSPGCPGDTFIGKGKITQKYFQGGEHLVDLDIWIENQKGTLCTPGKATVVLPSKG